MAGTLHETRWQEKPQALAQTLTQAQGHAELQYTENWYYIPVS